MEYILLSKEYYRNRDHYLQLYNDRYNGEFTLHFPIYINGNKAFMTYSSELLQLVAGIYKADKKLSLNIFNMPGIALEQFTRRCLVDEIKLTNDIEGVYSTRREIREFFKPEIRNCHSKRLYGLFQKYYMLSKQQRIRMETCQDIRSIYNDLVLDEVIEEDERNQPDGVIFRRDPVSIQGADLRVIHNGVNPEEKIIAYMDECLRIIHDDKLNPLIKIGLAHYFIGYIHPFYDGNGRLDRYISSYLLAGELHSLVGYSLSYTIKKKISSYYKSFALVNDQKNKGDVTPFVINFLGFVQEALDNLNEVMMEKTEKLYYYFNKIESCIKEEKYRELLCILVQNSLFGQEGMTIEELADVMEVSVPSVRKYINNIDKNMFIVSQVGHKKGYDFNLDYFDYDE